MSGRKNRLSLGPEKDRTAGGKAASVLLVFLGISVLSTVMTVTADDLFFGTGLYPMILVVLVLLGVAVGVRAARKRKENPPWEGGGVSRGRFDPEARDHQHIVAPGPSRRYPTSPGFNPSADTHEHIRVVSDDWVSRQLEQLETMKKAGLVEESEYRERKRKILSRRKAG